MIGGLRQIARLSSFLLRLKEFNVVLHYFQAQIVRADVIEGVFELIANIVQTDQNNRI